MFATENNTVEHVDPEIAAAIAREAVRQEQHIELIASENYTSPAVMQVQGGVLTGEVEEVRLA